MPDPTLEDVRELAEWHPPRGVISVYLHLDPGDRGSAWHTELRNGLAGIRQAAAGLDHEARKALVATTERIADRFGDRESQPLPRGEAGFVEVAPGPARERWWSSHLAPVSAASACFAETPVVTPLLSMLAREARRGIALVSTEHVRLLEWAPGRLEELHSWELTLFSGDWRERKAPRAVDPSRAQGISAAGRDQFGERLEENRQRFLGECARLAARGAAARGWQRIVAFGAPEHMPDFLDAAPGVAIEVGGDADLISVPAAELEGLVAKAIERLDGERDRLLVERALEETRGGLHGTAGPQETLAALEEGRVDCLLIDAGRAAAGPPAATGGGNGAIDSETLVRLALASGARIATVSGGAAGLLADADGVAALLRY